MKIPDMEKKIAQLNADNDRVNNTLRKKLNQIEDLKNKMNNQEKVIQKYIII